MKDLYAIMNTITLNECPITHEETNTCTMSVVNQYDSTDINIDEIIISDEDNFGITIPDVLIHTIYNNNV